MMTIILFTYFILSGIVAVAFLFFQAEMTNRDIKLYYNSEHVEETKKRRDTLQNGLQGHSYWMTVGAVFLLGFIFTPFLLIKLFFLFINHTKTES